MWVSWICSSKEFFSKFDPAAVNSFPTLLEKLSSAISHTTEIEELKEKVKKLAKEKAAAQKENEDLRKLLETERKAASSKQEHKRLMQVCFATFFEVDALVMCTSRNWFWFYYSLTGWLS